MKRVLTFILALVMTFSTIPLGAHTVSVNAEGTKRLEDYEIYPEPHEFNYEVGNFILDRVVNVVVEEGIDEYTVARLEETLDLKGISAKYSDAIVSDMTNILVGIKDSGSYVDTYFNDNYEIKHTDLWEHLDANAVRVDNNVITVLGIDTDAAFYGLTSLYHVFTQMDSFTIRNFMIDDFADVLSRGFIEGYYGEPWSQEDRVDLMTFGGYYKLNSYFYAPKDDPKHNAQWRDLYNAEELEDMRALAEAGNASKTRFVYALHPYMNRVIRYDNEANYQADMQIMKDKFQQMLDVGVRQFSILADDAGVPGNNAENYVRTLVDMTAWLESKQADYPGLKTVLPFVPNDYMGNGSSSQLQTLKPLPENIQIVMTGGKVWGEVSTSFTDTFTQHMDRGPYMWINWPCTDNSKKHLIMGGGQTFLEPGVDPASIEGIVLNPMQQSEPSKLAIFINAAYAWNIWDTGQDADDAWESAFSYIDHNNALETEASKAYRELSKHMINQDMDSRVKVLHESVDLAPILTSFKNKYAAGQATVADVDAVLAEFKILENAAITYRNNPGNPRTRDQILPWLNSWDDTTDAAIYYLEAVRAQLNNDEASLVTNYSQGQSAFAKSKTHGFSYIDHIEYAEVGVQHIVPFINTLERTISSVVEDISGLGPDVRFITNIASNPNGGSAALDNVIDGDINTFAYWQSFVIREGTYVGVDFGSKMKLVENFEFAMGHVNAAQRWDTMYNGVVQYTTDNKTWHTIDELTFNTQTNEIEYTFDEPMELRAIRVLSTSDVDHRWFALRDIRVNVKDEVVEVPQSYKMIKTERYKFYQGTESNLFDGNKDTFAWFDTGSAPEKDYIQVGDYVGFDLGAVEKLDEVRLTIGTNDADKYKKYSVETSIDGNTWTAIPGYENYVGTNSGKDDLTIALKGQEVRFVRVVNQQKEKAWVKFSEFGVTKAAPQSYKLIKTERYSFYNDTTEANLFDGNINTFAWFNTAGSGAEKDHIQIGDYVGFDLGQVERLDEVRLVIGGGDGDKYRNYAVQTSTDGENWTSIPGYENYVGVASGRDDLKIPLHGQEVRYVRALNQERRPSWVKFSEFGVTQTVDFSTDNVLTNKKVMDIPSKITDTTFKLGSGSTTLEPKEYYGLDLGQIHEISSSSFKFNNENLTLQSSKNMVEWVDGVTGDARYVRIINNTATAIELTIETFDIAVRKVSLAGFHDSDVIINTAYGNGDMRKVGNSYNVFDGKLDTSASISGYPQEGNYVIFDLGQERDIHSMRYYIQETNQNFIRNAEFEIASTPDGEYKPLFTVGDGNKDNTHNNDVAKDAEYLTHDSRNPGYMFTGNDDLDVKGRYVRVRFTSTYNHRFVAFNEILINDGDYVPVEVYKGVTSSSIEKPFEVASKMFDGDLKTAYTPANKQGEFTFHHSSPLGVQRVRLVQNGLVKGATLSAVIIDPTSPFKSTTIEIGSLDQAITEFNVPAGKVIKNLTVKWTDGAPSISEILSFTTTKAVDNTELKALIATVVDTKAWTLESIAQYETALNGAKNIVDNIHVSQMMIDSASAALKTAIENGVVKYTGTELAELTEAKISNADRFYTVKSFAIYENAINKGLNALSNPDNLSEADANALISSIKAAIDNLEYSIYQREIAETALKAIKRVDLNKENYTEASFNTYNALILALETLIADDKSETQVVNPQAFIDALDALENHELIDVKELRTLVNNFENVVESLYTPESYAAYKAAVDAAKLVLVDGSAKDVEVATQALKDAFKALELIVDQTLEDLIAQLKELNKDDFAKPGYDALMDQVAQYEATPPSDKQAAIAVLEGLFDKLVNIVDLKEVLESADKLSKDDYTRSSYEVFLKELSSVKEALNGIVTEEQKAALITQVEDAVKQLTERVSQEDYDAYIDGIVVKDEELYTESSYAEYAKALKALKELDLEDSSSLDFLDAVEAFEKAEANLVEVEEEVEIPVEVPEDGKNPEEGKPGLPGTGVNSNMTTFIIGFAVILMGLGILVKKRKEDNSI